jgi:hypothetical protein
MEYTRDELLNLFAWVRQAALTESLGQVTCEGDHEQAGQVGYVLRDGGHCLDCGAAV